MKRFVNKLKLLPIVGAILSSSVPMLNVALALAVSLTMAVNNTSATSYTNVPFIDDTHNEMLIAAGNLLPSGLDSRVLDSSGHELPRMLADNNTLFTANSTAHTSSTFTFTTGNTPSSTMPVITGVSGNVSTIDAPDLELDRHFDISISGYFNTSVNGTTQNILYKSGAAQLNVSAPSILTFHALNADNSDNWTMVSGAVASGNHTVRIWADGLTAYLSVDGSTADTQSLYTSNAAVIDGAATTTTYVGGIQRAVFHTQGLYWQFYVHSNNLQYRTSSDGSSWSAATAITSDNKVVDQKSWSLVFDGSSNVSYARFYGFPADGRFLYRKGAPQSDGSITWAAAEQTIDTGIGAGGNLQEMAISVSSDGHAMVYYSNHLQTLLYAIRNSNTDGTWATTGGYPQNISGSFSSSSSFFATTSDFDSNKQYVMWVTSGAVYGTYYNGSSWSGATDWWGGGIYTLPAGSLAINNDDDIVGVWNDNAGTIYLRERDSSGSFAAAQTFVSTNALNVRPSISYDNVSQNYVVFYESTADNDIYFKTYRSGTISSATKLATTTAGLSMTSSAVLYDNIFDVGTTNNPNVIHATMVFPWEWPDNANNWWWMTNNTMSYADNMTISVLGTQMLFYAPNNMIYGNSLPDRSAVGTHTGTIYWGTSTLTVSGAALLTLPATNITVNSATLNGQLLDMVGMSSYTTYFDYGLTTSYGNTASFGVMSAPGLLSANASALFPNTVYHFRAVAVSSNITLYGGDLTFTTLAGSGGGTFQFGGGNARVFKNYIANNDTLVTAEIVNTYVPYYPNQSPKEYFTVQLISTDNSTILAATPQQDWGDKPIGIYLNPTQSATITDGAGYYVRVQANFASNVSVQYQLQNVPWANDWKGADLTKLDDWCIYVALDMQTFYSGSGYVTVLTDRKLAITDAVGGYFTAGIAGIGQIRPNLFTTSQQSPVFTSGISGLPADNTTAYTAYVGSAIAADAAVMAVPFGLTARDVLAAVIGLSMLGVIMTGVSAMGGFGALGLFLISIPFLWLGTYFKIIGVQWVMILTIIFGFFAVRQFIIKTT